VAPEHTCNSLPLSGSPPAVLRFPWEFFIRPRCACYQRSSLASGVPRRRHSRLQRLVTLAGRRSRYFLVPAGTPASPESCRRYICYRVHVHTRIQRANRLADFGFLRESNGSHVAASRPPRDRSFHHVSDSRINIPSRA